MTLICIYVTIYFMSNPIENSAGFNRPRPTDDPYIASQYDRLGLGEAPSLEAIEPHALGIMRDNRILEGIGLVLGRRIDARNTQTDPDLRDLVIVAMKNPEQAFGGLLFKLALEELEPEH